LNFDHDSFPEFAKTALTCGVGSKMEQILFDHNERGVLLLFGQSDSLLFK
jgi:hypothetical protein